jgi:hypothetical protein
MRFWETEQIEEHLSASLPDNFSVLDIQHKSAVAIEQQINNFGTPLYLLFILLALAFLLTEVVLIRLWKS